MLPPVTFIWVRPHLLTYKNLYYFYSLWKKQSFPQSCRLHETLASALPGGEAFFIWATKSRVYSKTPLALPRTRPPPPSLRYSLTARHTEHAVFMMQDVSEIRVHATGASLLCSRSHSRVQQAAEVCYGNSVLLKVFWEIYGHWTPLLAPRVFTAVDTYVKKKKRLIFTFLQTSCFTVVLFRLTRRICRLMWPTSYLAIRIFSI